MSSQRRQSQSRFQNKRKKQGKPSQAKGTLAKNAPPIDVTITHIGGRGDGVGTALYTHNYQTKEHMVFVPDTLPGEVVSAQPTSLTGQGIQAKLRELISAAPTRKEPDCGASPACGGCQFQHMTKPAYQAWKEETLRATLAKAGILPEQWKESYFAGPHNRRRARLAIRRRKEDVLIGFRERASHQIIYPTGCVILAKPLLSLIEALRTDLLLFLEDGMTGELDITLCDRGCDIALHCDAPWPQKTLTALTAAAAANEAILRLSLIEKNQPATLLFVKEAPTITWQFPDGATRPKTALHPSPASFLQADSGAEAVMQKDVYLALKGATTIIDLFAGSGTLSAPLLFHAPPPAKLSAFDSVRDALQAYSHIADHHGLSMHLETQIRHLSDAPLTAKELEGIEAIIIDPPRSGAAAQMPALATSAIPKVMMISCNPHSFAKDAAILVEGGYHCEWARLIDQFALTSHCEIIAFFTKEVEEVA